MANISVVIQVCSIGVTGTPLYKFNAWLALTINLHIVMLCIMRRSHRKEAAFHVYDEVSYNITKLNTIMELWTICIEQSKKI